MARLCIGCFSTTELLCDLVLLSAAYLMKFWLFRVWGSNGTCTFSTMSDMLCLVERTVLFVYCGIEMLWLTFAEMPSER
jgi:hypothetical protein